jgi:hypothetical protein
MAHERMDRRTLLHGVGAATAGLMVGSVSLSAQAAPAAPAAQATAATPATTFQPMRHPQDAWLDAVPGKHRVVLDAVSPDGAAQGIGYSNNVFNANRSGYQLENADIALVLVLRHHATAFAFNNAMWKKYGKVFAELTSYKHPTDPGPPTSNPRNSGERPPLDRLVARGAHIIVCGLATNLYAGQIAGEGGDRAAVYKELESNMVANAHIMSAGVVGITRAQEYGYSMIYVG